jgi:hypothetical protein
MILTGQNLFTQKKICPSSHLSSTNPTWTGLGLNPGMYSEAPVTNERSANKGTGVFHVILLVVTCVCL